jgi:molybdate transport system ATP-binding protein
VQAAEGVALLYVTHSPDEAVTLGSRLFLLGGGRVVAEGPPLDVLAAARNGTQARLDGVRNVFRGRVEGEAGGGAVRVVLDGGTGLAVARKDLAAGDRVVVSVLAEEVLLARGAVEGLSARNVIAGEVARVIPHGDEAEVLVSAGGQTWVCSVVETAVQALGLQPGATVYMIVKARSCHTRPDRAS